MVAGQSMTMTFEGTPMRLSCSWMLTAVLYITA